MDKFLNKVGRPKPNDPASPARVVQAPSPRPPAPVKRTRSTDSILLESPRKGLRVMSLKNRVTNSKIIEDFEESVSKVTVGPEAKGKWTVPLVIKQLKTGKITLKFLATIKQLLLSSQENIDTFIQQDGFSVLITLPAQFDYKNKTHQVKHGILELFCCCISSPKLFSKILDNSSLLNTITLWAREPDNDSDLKSMIFTLLGVLPYFVEDSSLASEAYQKVIEALEALRYKYGDGPRFKELLDGLKFEKDEKVILSILVLINTLVNLPEELEDRLAMRAEFKGLGIDEAINRILDEELDTDDVWDIIKSWKNDALDDEEDYEDRVAELTKHAKSQDTQSYLDMLDGRVPKHLRRSMDEIIKRLLFMPIDNTNNGLQKWLLVERILRQITNENAQQVTFDNRNWFSVDELLEPLAQEATSEKQNQKMFEDKTKLEHEVTKLEKQLVLQKKAVQDKEQQLAEKIKEIDLLKANQAKVVKEHTEVITNTREDLRLVEDEKKEIEAKFKNLTAEQKKIANDMVAKLQRERARARNAELQLAETKRELLKVQQEREEEKLFLASKIRSEMEADKKEEIHEAKKRNPRREREVTKEYCSSIPERDRPIKVNSKQNHCRTN